jgi:glycosyltransferase involved in cell wall biosynthesis
MTVQRRVSVSSLDAIVSQRPEFLALVRDAQQARYRSQSSRAVDLTQRIAELEANARPARGRDVLKGVPRRQMERAQRFVRRGVRRFFRSEGSAVRPPDCGPAVTIILTVFNQSPEEIRTAVDSVLAQTLADIELIVWDDGSSNVDALAALDSLRALRQFAEGEAPLARVFQAPNQGVIGARNSALKCARGYFVVFLDPDDQLRLTYLEKAVIKALASPWASVVSPHTSIVGMAREDAWYAEPLSSETIGRNNHVPVASLVTRDALEKVGGFSRHMNGGYEDWELWVRLANAGHRGVVLDDFLFDYTYSAVSGRNAGAVQRHDDLVRTIRHRNARRPKINGRDQSNSQLVGDSIGRFGFHIPHGSDRPVIFVVPWLIRGGGAERFLLSLAARLVASGRTVVFVSTLGCPAGMVDGRREFQNVTPYVYDLPTFLAGEDYAAFFDSLLTRLIEPVVVNVGSSWLYGRLDSNRPPAWNGVRIMDILFNPIGHMPAFLERQGHFHAVVAVYESLSDVLVSYFQTETPTFTIPVGIELPDSISQLEIRPPDRLRIGWLGRMSEEKRPEIFVLIAQALQGKADFVMAGSGPQEDAIRSMARGVQGLEFCGFVEDAAEFHRGIDLLVNTSAIEGISVTAMEALAHNVPVVATRVGGMSELIVDGENGYLIDSGQVFGETVMKIGELIETPQILQNLRRGIEMSGIPDRFTVETMAAAYAELFDAPWGAWGDKD